MKVIIIIICTSKQCLLKKKSFVVIVMKKSIFVNICFIKYVVIYKWITKLIYVCYIYIYISMCFV